MYPSHRQRGHGQAVFARNFILGHNSGTLHKAPNRCIHLAILRIELAGMTILSSRSLLFHTLPPHPPLRCSPSAPCAARVSRARTVAVRATAQDLNSGLGFETMRSGVKVAAKESILTPRFYTTDFDEMEQIFSKEINPNLDMTELNACLQEFRNDYNKVHFVRNETFKVSSVRGRWAVGRARGSHRVPGAPGGYRRKPCGGWVGVAHVRGACCKPVLVCLCTASGSGLLHEYP